MEIYGWHWYIHRTHQEHFSVTRSSSPIALYTNQMLVCVSPIIITQYRLSPQPGNHHHAYTKKNPKYPPETALRTLQSAILLSSCIRNATEYLRVLKRWKRATMEKSNCIPVKRVLNVKIIGCKGKRKTRFWKRNLLLRFFFVAFQIATYFGLEVKENR